MRYKSYWFRAAKPQYTLSQIFSIPYRSGLQIKQEIHFMLGKVFVPIPPWNTISKGKDQNKKNAVVGLLLLVVVLLIATSIALLGRADTDTPGPAAIRGLDGCDDYYVPTCDYDVPADYPRGRGTYRSDYKNRRVPYEYYYDDDVCTMDSKCPLFVYTDGTENSNDLTERDPVFVTEMARRGYFSAAVDYYDLFGLYMYGWIKEKAAYIYDFTPGSKSVIDQLCSSSDLPIDCGLGVAVAGWSQGANIASLARNYCHWVTAALLFGNGHKAYQQLGDDYGLLINVQTRNEDLLLPENRRRSIAGEMDATFGGSFEGVEAQQIATSGYDCSGKYDCLNNDEGAGYFIVKDAPHNVMGVDSTWFEKFMDPSAKWGLPQNFDWLAERGRDTKVEDPTPIDPSCPCRRIEINKVTVDGFANEKKLRNTLWLNFAPAPSDHNTLKLKEHYHKIAYFEGKPNVYIPESPLVQDNVDPSIDIWWWIEEQDWNNVDNDVGVICAGNGDYRAYEFYDHEGINVGWVKCSPHSDRGGSLGWYTASDPASSCSPYTKSITFNRKQDNDKAGTIKFEYTVSPSNCDSCPCKTVEINTFEAGGFMNEERENYKYFRNKVYAKVGPHGTYEQLGGPDYFVGIGKHTPPSPLTFYDLTKRDNIYWKVNEKDWNGHDESTGYICATSGQSWRIDGNEHEPCGLAPILPLPNKRTWWLADTCDTYTKSVYFERRQDGRRGWYQFHLSVYPSKGCVAIDSTSLELDKELAGPSSHEVSNPWMSVEGSDGYETFNRAGPEEGTLDQDLDIMPIDPEGTVPIDPSSLLPVDSELEEPKAEPEESEQAASLAKSTHHIASGVRIDPSSNDEVGALSAGAIAGIVVGALVVVVGAAAIVVNKKKSQVVVAPHGAAITPKEFAGDDLEV